MNRAIDLFWLALLWLVLILQIFHYQHKCFKISWINVRIWVLQMHIELINNLKAHNRSACKSLCVVVKNQCPTRKNEWASGTRLLCSISRESWKHTQTQLKCNKQKNHRLTSQFYCTQPYMLVHIMHVVVIMVSSNICMCEFISICV